ncbi:MAG: DUF3244 domain-containing protein [Ignavibacteria bacterium]|jgi:hypothetical protein|nr:DUF3244 domain-containing protein [Ignavibacteria bacterium]
MKKYFFYTIILCVALATSTNLLAVDSVVVQTFTFDSIITRQAMFHFPDASEKFYKVIAKYRLKCDSKTQHDKFECGEWDYHAYTRIIKNAPFTTRQHPKTTFGDFRIPEGGVTIKLAKPYEYDDNKFYDVPLVKTTAMVNNAVEAKLPSGDSLFPFNANHQFMFLVNDLTNAGLKAGSKIGRMLIEGSYADNLLYYLKNVYVRYAAFPKTTSIQTTYYEGPWDTIAFQSYITEVVGDKLAIDFNKDLVWDGNTNLYFEIITDGGSDVSQVALKARVPKGARQAHIAAPYGYAKLAGGNSWIEGQPLPTISGGSHFTMEGWFKLATEDAVNNENAILMSLGKNIVIRLGDANNRNKVYVDMLNVNTYTCGTNDAIPFDRWVHIAVVFNGQGQTYAERLAIYINGQPVSMYYNLTYQVAPTPATFAIGRGMYLGVDNAIKNLRALVSDVRVWDVSLTNDEILANLGAVIDNTNPHYSNLVANYKWYNEGCKLIGDVEYREDNIGARYTQGINIIPNVTLVAGDFTYDTENTSHQDTMRHTPVTLVRYKDDATLDYPQVESVENYQIPFGDFGYDVTAGDEFITYKQENYAEFEIFRFITPYGINLTLGKDGFEWQYDLTDFMNDLRGDVVLSSHNLQELLDLKFIFYKGEPYREVLRIQEPWGPTQHSRAYKDLINNKQLPPVMLDILPETKSVKLKTRITGHGMNAGGNIQCCEFYPNTHYLYAGSSFNNLDSASEWMLWVDCSTNPVYPQGGTWIIQREGWCPGDVVNEHDIELMQFVSDGKLAIDYGISDEAYNKAPAVGDGYYTMGFQLVEYGESRYQNDLELYKVLSPSMEDYYRRFNPICDGFKFVIRNNSDSPISSLTLVLESNSDKGHQAISDDITLSKPLMPYQFDTLTYFIKDAASAFWYVLSGVANPTVGIGVSAPNGVVDDNPTNNTILQPIQLPDVYDKNNFVLKYRTNKRPSEYTVRIYDYNNNVVKQITGAQGNADYELKINDLSNGCYRFEIEDIKGINGQYAGLSFWYYESQGNGSIGIYDSTGKKSLKAFNPDFGKNIIYSFVVDGWLSIAEDENMALSIYPNPTSDILNIQSYEAVQNAVISIFNDFGDVVYTSTANVSEGETISINMSRYPSGAYSVRISNGKRITWGKFVKK